MRTRFGAAMVVVAVVAASASALQPWDVIPTSGEIAGWVINVDSIYMCTHRRVTQPESLFLVINGGAPVYNSRGFVNGVFEGYRRDTVEVCLEVYNQGTPDNALSVFAFRGTRLTDTLHVDIPGAAGSRTSGGGEYTYVVDMVAGQFYVKLTTAPDNASRSAAYAFLVNIVQAAGANRALMRIPARASTMPTTQRRIGIAGSLNRGPQVTAFDMYGRRLRAGACPSGVVVLE